MKPWAKRAIGGSAAVAAALGAGGIYAASNDNGGDSGGGEVSCDQSVSTAPGLSSALRDAAGTSGDTVCVTASLTGGPINMNTTMTAQVRVLAQPTDQTIDMVSVNFGARAENVTIEGFEFTNEHGISLTEGMDTIKVIRNYFHDQVLDAVSAGPSCSGTRNDFEFLGNKIDMLEYDGDFPHGYGIYGACFDGIKINYNECNGGSDGSINTMADCWEIGDSRNFEQIGNYIHDNGCNDCNAVHADGFQWWNGSTNGVIRDNVVITFAQTSNSPDGSDVLVENNLIVNAQGNCHEAHPNETSGEVQPLRFTYRNNTIWDCGFDAMTMSGASLRGRGSNVWEDNIFETATCVTGTFATAPAGNVIGGSLPCGISSNTNSSSWSPDWNGTDFASAGQSATYQPTNLPTGYEGAGYQPAPFGPDACDC